MAEAIRVSRESRKARVRVHVSQSVLVCVCTIHVFEGREKELW